VKPLDISYLQEELVVNLLGVDKVFVDVIVKSLSRFVVLLGCLRDVNIAFGVHIEKI
jgi:hypothetical protein